tara:strand:+ start:177 stop:617 length:441 start_codon:yes stop_codon:yes gene_type:complete
MNNFFKIIFGVGIFIIVLMLVGLLMEETSPKNEVKKEKVEKPNNKSISRFEKPSKNQLNIIKFGLSTKLNIKRSVCTKSNSFENVYFVGVEFDNDLVGVWMISGQKTDPGMTFSVNSISQEYSNYPIRDKYDKYEDGYLELVRHFD